MADQNAPEVCLRAWCKAIGYQDGALIKTQGDFFKLLAHTPSFNYDNQINEVLKSYQINFANKTWLIDFANTKDKDVSLLLPEINPEKLGFQLLIPILSKGQHWGFCLLKPKTNEQLALNWELRDYLIAVTEQISSYLFMSEASRTLSENAQFMAFSRMSAFVVHDLKNVKAQIDMLLKNAQKHRHNPEFIDDAFATVAAMQTRLGNMLGQLTNKQSNHEQTKRIRVGELLAQIIQERCQSLLPSPELQILQDGQLQIDVERFGNVVFHLIDNAQQATADDGYVQVIVNQLENLMIIRIVDSGCGMSAEFIRDRLFKPFDTTKGNAGMGIGAFDAQTFVQTMHGHLSVESSEGSGTTFTIQLPINYNQTNTRNVV
ncbi:MAG: XrtA/PEP-CTERM system histidine kinase PrsK [Rheinheimera sp.]|nr:XrtA/PEP-CTERM system histidine kinase PrsK [Rheinheimera sp.]